MENFWKTAVAVVSFALPWTTPVFALQSQSPTNSSVLPLIVKGEKLAPLLGTGNHKLSAFTCESGKPQAVVFQIDEINSEGRILPGPAPEFLAADEQPGILDSNDEFVVMLKDLGEECNAEVLSRVQGQLITLKVAASYLASPAFLYILASDRGYTPSTSYVTYDAATHTVKTPGYLWGYEPDHPFLYTRMGFADLQGHAFEDVFDRLKARFRVKAVGQLVTLNINEDDFDAKLVGMRVGPVRAVRELAITVSPVPGLVVDAIVTFQHYERLWRAHIRFRLPKAAAFFTSSMDLSLTHDFTSLQGVQFSTSGLSSAAVVDGTMLESERSIVFGSEPWYMLSGRGINQITAVELDPGLNLTAAARFVDSTAERDPPEEVPGSLPAAAYQFLGWEGLKSQWYSFGANIAMLPRIPERGASGYYKVLHAPVSVEVSARP